MKLFGVAAPTTGSGKTSITLAILSRLRNATAFKIGPDYIDGGLSSAITGNMTWNIDRWIQGKAYSQVIPAASQKYDFGVVEGVMGLRDSGSPVDLSTYFYFRKFRIPYILVVDVSLMAESAYYLARGFLSPLSLGVILNKYGSERHLEMVSRPFREHGIRILGAVPGNKEFAIPERHLGLHTASEMTGLREKAAAMSIHIDMGFLDELPDRQFIIPSYHQPKSTGKSIWVAQDKAFNFYYADSLTSLEGMGTLNYFSPIAGEYPEDPDLVYFGGGYPELYPGELSRNDKLRRIIADFSESHGNIIAECGGLMYLEKDMETDQGVFPMAGIFQGRVRKNSRLTLGYTKLQAREDTLLFRKGEIAMGHEFHYSTIEDPGKKALHNIIGKGIDGDDGLVLRNTMGSYSHFSLSRYSRRLRKALDI